MMLATTSSSINKRKKIFKTAAPLTSTLKMCSKCGDFQSNDLNEFTEHMKFEHNLDEIYPCDLCSFYTESLWDYQVHMEKSHNRVDRVAADAVLDEEEEGADDMLDEDQQHNEEEEFDEEDEDDNKESILYSSSSSSSISFNSKRKINSDQELETKSKSQPNDKMLFDLANQYSSQSQLSQLIQKYNQQLNTSALGLQIPRSNLQTQNVAPVLQSHPEKAKRHYNSEVDPARYRKVLEEGITKFACSICGNTYKWRKSLNKHWKEKHITETPPPLDAPVAVKLRNGNTTTTTTPTHPAPLPIVTTTPKKADTNPISNVLNVFQQYFNSMPKQPMEDATAPLDLSMKPKRERSQSPDVSQRSNSASSTSSSSNSSTSASASSSSDSAESQPNENQQACGDMPAKPAANLNSSNNTQAYNQKLFICSVCDAKFHVVDQINEHFLKNHYNEYQRELSSKSPPRNTNVAQQNEEWNLSDPQNPLKCIKCDFVGRWPTELQKHAASHSTSRPFKCLICSLTYKWRWDLAKHFDRTHPSFRNPYKKRDRDAARSTLINPTPTSQTPQQRRSRSRSRSNESDKKKYEQISINPNTPPLSSSSSTSSSCSIQPPTAAAAAAAAAFMPPFLSPQSQNAAAMYAAYLLSNPAFLNNPLFAMAALQNQVQEKPIKKQQPPQQPQQEPELPKTNLAKKIKLEEEEKEARNFQCFWCDFRGRWRSEIIQHMRCHHAREKPYRCSSCMYASNWKWDVQKHTKKQHPNNVSAKIVEIPDQVLFPDLKDLNFFDSIKQVNGNESPIVNGGAKKSLNLTPPSSSSSSTSSISSVSSKPVKKANTTLNCAQCPYVACNLSDLRRHLIVHSNEQPYHCCSCSFKSKWKSDVKKHQRSSGHIGPILVGKKAMQKVIENLGLSKRDLPTNIDVIDNRQCKSNEKLIDEEEMNGKRKDMDEDTDEEVYEQLNEDEEYFDEDEVNHAEQYDEDEEVVEEDEGVQDEATGELEIDHDEDY